MNKFAKRSAAVAGATLFASTLVFTACGEVRYAEGSFREYRYNYEQNTLKAVCDADMTIDGELSEARWEDPDLQWLEHREHSSEVYFKYTTSFSEKGVYIAAVSEDWRIYYRSPYSNIKNTTFDIYLAREDDYALNDRIFLSFNCGNTAWAHGLYSYLGHVTVQGGEPNSDTCTGMTLEAFVPWSQFGYTSKPEKIRSVCTYQLINSSSANAIELQPGYVNGNSYGKFYEFGEHGFLSADGEYGTLGDSKSGYCKGPDWDVSRAEEDVFSSNKAQQNRCMTGQTYIFYRDVRGDSYSVSATFTPNLHGDGTCGIASTAPRAGLMTGYNEFCFSALMIDMSKSYLDSKTLVLTSSYTHGGSTAHNIIYKSEAGEYDVKKGITLTCVKYGALFYYYVGEGEDARLIYQEEIALLNGEAEPGIQTTNCDVTVTEPSASYYQTADKDDILGYLNNTGIYIVSAENGTGGSVTPETYSVRRGEDLALSIAPNSGVYRLESLQVAYDGGEWQDVTESARAETSDGRFVLKNIRNNVSVRSSFARNDAAMSAVTGTVSSSEGTVSGATVAFENKADKTLYFTANTNTEGSYSIRVPAGEYRVIVKAKGFKSAESEVSVSDTGATKDVTLEPAIVGGSVSVKGTVYRSSTRCDDTYMEDGIMTFASSGDVTDVAWLSAIGAVSGDFKATAVYEYLMGSDSDPSAGFVIADGNCYYALYVLATNTDSGSGTGFRFYHPADWWANRYQNRNSTPRINLQQGKVIMTLTRVGNVYTLYADTYSEGMTEAVTRRGSVEGGITHKDISYGTFVDSTFTVPQGTVAVGLSVMGNSSFRVQALSFTEI